MQTCPWALFALSYRRSATVIDRRTSALKSPKPLLAELTGEVAAVSVGCLGQNSQLPFSPLQFSFIKQPSQNKMDSDSIWTLYVCASWNDTLQCHIDSIPMAIWFSSSSSIIHQRTVLCHTQTETGRCPSCTQHSYSDSNQNPGHSQHHRVSSSSVASQCCRAVNPQYYHMYTFPQHMAIMSLLLQLCGQCRRVASGCIWNPNCNIRPNQYTCWVCTFPRYMLLLNCHSSEKTEFPVLNCLSVSCWVRCFLTSAFAAPGSAIRDIVPAHSWRETHKNSCVIFSLYSTTSDMVIGNILTSDNESTVGDGANKVICCAVQSV